MNTARQLVHFISYLSASDRHWLHVDYLTRDDSIVCMDLWIALPTAFQLLIDKIESLYPANNYKLWE
jgi:hypothetical protein